MKLKFIYFKNLQKLKKNYFIHQNFKYFKSYEGKYQEIVLTNKYLPDQ